MQQADNLGAIPGVEHGFCTINDPLLIQILLIYLGLPQLGVVPGAISAGIIALSLNYGAYLSEIFRAG
ncbi:ABC transporter permease subunit, partial [Klebsiella pneumoniae]|uniref:ABC transporter permease subunit n=1 Tax=Klebsiella pneumoniae TaxID=573 RepID=UPI0027315E86